MQALRDEMKLRDETRELENAKAAVEKEEFASRARKLGDEQDRIKDHTDTAIGDIEAIEGGSQKFGKEISPKTTVLILGDARNNYHASQAWVLKEIEKRARHLYWLNPEPKSYWDTGDSIVGEYANHCDGTFECRNLRQLERFVDYLA